MPLFRCREKKIGVFSEKYPSWEGPCRESQPGAPLQIWGFPDGLEGGILGDFGVSAEKILKIWVFLPFFWISPQNLEKWVSLSLYRGSRSSSTFFLVLYWRFPDKIWDFLGGILGFCCETPIFGVFAEK